MIGLAKLVTGRLETDEDAHDGDRRDCRSAASNYGISRLGLTTDREDSSEALKPSFGDEVERGLETPAPSKETDKPESEQPSGDRCELPEPPAAEQPTVDPVKLPDNRPKGYKKTSVKMPREMAVRLKAFSRATGNYQYAVVAEAVGRFLDDAIPELSDDSRRRMRDLAEQFRRNENRSRWREIFSFRWK